MKKTAIISLLILLIGGFLFTPQGKLSSVKQPTKHVTASPTSFDNKRYSLTDVSSPWVIVNKQRPLSPLTYVPTDLVIPRVPLQPGISYTEEHVRKDTASALEQLVSAAKAENIKLNLLSGYRSYYFQENLYSRYVSEQGQNAADTFSARAGYSEHQTGLTADIGLPNHSTCNLDQCFANTTEGQWLANNAYKYGFIIRYPANEQQVTGYKYEPWHIRYVGTYLSKRMFAVKSPTLESFFGLSAAPNY